MKCAWKELIAILPRPLQNKVDNYSSECVQELRLRINHPTEIITNQRRISVGQPVAAEELSHIVNAASRYSPWLATTSAFGYITAPGGHRIGICGDAVMKEGSMSGFRKLRSINIRVARDFPGISGSLWKEKGSLLIAGNPGCGKTTLLRDLIRQRSAFENISVVDERGELFPEQGGFETGSRTDVLTGCGKPQGIENLLKTMGPDTIAVDEITSEEDIRAVIHAGRCGVHLLATIHAHGKQDFLSSARCAPLVTGGIFDHFVFMAKDKSWWIERNRI